MSAIGENRRSPFYFSEKISEKASLFLVGRYIHPHNNILESVFCPQGQGGWDPFCCTKKKALYEGLFNAINEAYVAYGVG